MPDVNMPKLSDTMEEGSVLAWKKADGDEVRRGDTLAEIETDKASFEIEAEADGVLRIVAETGHTVPVGGVIARIGAAGEAPSKPAGPAAQGAGAAAEAPRGRGEAAEGRIEPAAGSPVEPEEAAGRGERDEAEEEPAPVVAGEEAGPEPAPPLPAAGPARRAEEGRVKASPLARRLAEERGVDLAAVRGTGPAGRIVKEDVLAAAESAGAGRTRAAGPRPGAARQAPAGPEVVVEPATRMQAAVARRMAQAKATVPHFYVTVEARVDEAVKMRAQLKEAVPGAERVTVTDMVVRAAAIALGGFPSATASWVDGHFEMKRRVNIGIAVALDKGLVVPVLKDADRKDLVQISIESRELVERARAGRLSEEDLAGGTFSISNLGMLGVDEFSAIVNPPEAAILAVGAIKDAPAVVDGRIEPAKLMRMTISADHRVLYGADAARLLAEIKRLLENPVSLVVGG